ncbi:Lrp/AsnC family transcriptional regulator [Bradyrhizobium sp. STM 3809]|uniref:Lrp/AsnC family transcriptional regulator n=1 Tax=Bradyrhizobium sp. STM 3809 TaxID=551936 RepID=UPI0002409D1B|nr:Lrp/AsnC family transcriptional regulator [Bradyrhizobium sp. STM 3809]CCE01677.1 putative Transcriptional regulator, AsnC/Lrp family [Bradyrhizobium sp. STM 3809]
MDIDRTNKRIIALLEQNARLSATAIGREIGLSRPAVQERIQAMEQSGIIQGYHATTGEAAGLTRAVLFIRIAERPCAKALAWLSSREGVLSVMSLAGEWDALATVALPSVADLSALNDEIATSPLVAEARSQIILQTYAKAAGSR